MSSSAVITNDGEGPSTTIHHPEVVEDTKNGVTQSLPPSHILEDGRLIYLPPPDARERTRFFERSIARYGLLQADMETKEEDKSEDHESVQRLLETKEDDTNNNNNNNNNDDDSTNDKTAPKVHPLAIASARIQSNGLNELNRAINLSTLVNTGEYFSYTNVVDPSFEKDAKETEASGDASLEKATAQKTAALFSLKRKYSQFEKASTVLTRHESRLWQGIQAQQVIDRRLFRLRQQWRLVAPEHGTRAKLHAARTNEIIAVDVDVYDRDRVHGGNQALLGSRSKIGLAGRLASRVPRFATIELTDDFKVPEHDAASENDDPMEDVQDETEDSTAKWTRAEPFAIADPTLGRVLENFDPSKIPMLNLQLDIQKSSTSFQQSAFLEPMTTLSKSSEKTDEALLISLQHSLFCANLFESMRSELDPHTTATKDAAAKPFSAKRPRAVQSMAWLASESEENFVAPPSFLVGDRVSRGLAPLSVVHCHEGEVKVQLDAEYQLCLKLVEANAEQTITKKKKEEAKSSGSQSPAQLHAFCKALLLYAQDVYHKHSLYLHERETKLREDEKAKGDQPKGLARIKKEDVPEKARILQSCVSLGAKMLFEQRIRKALRRVHRWLQTKHGEPMVVEWLPLSIFDLHSKFTIGCRQLVLDGVLAQENLTMTKIAEDSEEFKKVHFKTEKEFELYLKLELGRQFRR